MLYALLSGTASVFTNTRTTPKSICELSSRQFSVTLSWPWRMYQFYGQLDERQPTSTERCKNWIYVVCSTMTTPASSWSAECRPHRVRISWQCPWSRTPLNSDMSMDAHITLVVSSCFGIRYAAFAARCHMKHSRCSLRHSSHLKSTTATSPSLNWRVANLIGFSLCWMSLFVSLLVRASSITSHPAQEFTLAPCTRAHPVQVMRSCAPLLQWCSTRDRAGSSTVGRGLASSAAFSVHGRSSGAGHTSCNHRWPRLRCRRSSSLEQSACRSAIHPDLFCF